jgi:hypothetical protein
MLPLKVLELSERSSNFLVPPRPAEPGTCITCHSAIDGDYPRCYPCHQARSTADARLADAVVPISLAVKQKQLATELWKYKSDVYGRRYFLIGLAAVLFRFLDAHEGCVARTAGTAAFDVVAVVPSTKHPPADQPLRELVSTMVTPVQARFADVLHNNGTATGRELDPRRYTAASTVRGRSVLLIEDTWTTGGHAQSASWALKNSSATAVGIVVIGRHFDPGFRRNATYLTGAQQRRFSWNTCCVHGTTS